MREQILRAAKNANPGGVMDEPIYDGEIIGILGEASSTGYILDVPISRLIGLLPRKYYSSNTTWRKAVKGLKCEGWEEVEDEIEDYFTSKLNNREFPVAGSEGELRFGSTGDAIFCEIGNHRASAAKAWLAYNQNEEAIFNNVYCCYRPLREPIKKLIEQCLKEGSQLKVFVQRKQGSFNIYKRFGGGGLSNLILVNRNNGGIELYNILSEKRLELLSPRKNFLSFILKWSFPTNLLCLGFKDVSPNLMKKMLNDDSFFKLAQNEHDGLNE